jgi:hypothetical protein
MNLHGIHDARPEYDFCPTFYFMCIHKLVRRTSKPVNFKILQANRIMKISEEDLGLLSL